MSLPGGFSGVTITRDHHRVNDGTDARSRECRRVSRRWIAALIVSLAAARAASAAPTVNVIELDNRIISPVTQQYITDSIDRSERENASCLVMILDTPGGLLESTRAIVKRMINARVPIVVYIAPSGARAGSAGVFITLASHVAAMAPSTNIGAAHPVMAGDSGPENVRKFVRRIHRAADESGHEKHKRGASDDEIVEEREADPLGDKILNDTVAWITGIAKMRHRNEEWAKKAVTESVSVTEDEAVKERIVDFVAKDLDALLARLDGWPVQTISGDQTIATAGAQVVRLPMTTRQQFFAVLTNPNVAYLLMMLGTLGLIFEFTHPGAAFPGIAGAICVILAMYAFQTLPVNYAGLALLGLGLALLVAEIKIASFGLLAVGGVVALTLGSLLLFETPWGVGVSLRVVVPVVGGVAVVVLGLISLAIRAHRRPAMSGSQALLGQTATAETDLTPDGHIFLRGELWRAVSAEPVKKGERVTVMAIDGLTVRVSKAQA